MYCLNKKSRKYVAELFWKLEKKKNLTILRGKYFIFDIAYVATMKGPLVRDIQT